MKSSVRAVPSASGSGHCFGCSPRNLAGLQMTFEIEANRVRACVSLSAEFESFPGMIHSGIAGTLLDETMAQMALRAGRCPATTTSMSLRYAQVMQTSRPYAVVADLVSREGDLIRVHGRLETLEGALVAAAEGTFMLWTPERRARPLVVMSTIPNDAAP